MKRRLLLLLGLLLWFSSLVSLSAIRKQQTPAERIGYIPSPEVTYLASLEFKLLFSELLFYNSIFYYGAIIDTPGQRPDYARLYTFLDTSTRLNPYNIDAYYFAQAILVWDGGMVNASHGSMPARK